MISYNLQTLEFLRDYGAAEATLSPELNIGQIRSLAANSPLPLTCIVHGKLELMVSEYCVIGSFLGGEGQNTCTHPCTKKSYALKDRKDALFPLVTDQFCHMHILNSKTLSMMPHVMEFESWGIHSLRIEAKAMNPDQIRRIVRAYQTAAAFPVEPDEAQKIGYKHKKDLKLHEAIISVGYFKTGSATKRFRILPHSLFMML